MIKIVNRKEKCVADVSGELTIYSAEAFKAEISPLIEETKPVEMVLRGVTEIDTAGVQLLMMLKQERQRLSKALSLVKHSKAILDAFELFNLVPYFNDPVMLSRKKGEKNGA